LVSLNSVVAADAAPPELTAEVASPLDVKAGTIALTLPATAGQKQLTVTDSGARAKLENARSGDVVRIGVDNASTPQQIVKLMSLARPVPLLARLIAVSVSGLILLLLAGIVTGWKPLRFVLGVDNRYSNSQTQLALWFGVVATVYLTAFALRIFYLGTDYIGGVGLTEHVMELTGLSALSFGGAKVITAQKVANAEEKGLPPGKLKAARPNLLRDLVTNDAGQADLGDFQMILITIVAVIIFLLSSIHFLERLAVEQQIVLPDVDTALLSGFGLGQGAYLLKKAALKLGEG
jgi:hypothetical protein